MTVLIKETLDAAILRRVNGIDLRMIPNVKRARLICLKKEKAKGVMQNKMDTLKIDISARPIDTGPLTETITIPCSKHYKELVDYMVRLTGQDIDTLGHRWILQGMIKDIERIFEFELYLDKSLKEVLR